MPHPSYKRFRQTLLTAAITALSGATIAQPSQETPRFTGLEEIVVTAQRRQESLHEVPAVVALTADALEQRGVADTIALPEAVPSVKYTSSGPIRPLLHPRRRQQQCRTR